MLKLLFLTSILSFLATAVLAADPDIASTIIAMERAALDRSDKGDIEPFLALSDEDVVYFDPSLEQPIYGVKNLAAYYHKVFSPSDGFGVMSNAKVQAAGDAAVLTFNYTSKAKDGTPTAYWNATEVYKRTPKGWRIIHTHWAYTKSVPEKRGM